MTNEVRPSSVAMAIRHGLKLKTTESLFVIVDACQAHEFVTLVGDRYAQPARTLFKGAAATCTEMLSVAPYFFQIDLGTDFLEQWSVYHRKNAGILFISAATPREVFRHLRKIFVVQDDEGQEHFFRFYDPRVLRVYLPSCTPDELTEFFGPVKRFIVENENGNALEEYSFDSVGATLRSNELKIAVDLQQTE